VRKNCSTRRVIQVATVEDPTMQDPRTNTAYHEAGHAVATLALEYDLECVSIRPNDETNSLGQTKSSILSKTITRKRIRSRDTFDESEIKTIHDHVVDLLAGDVAEAVLAGSPHSVDPLHSRTRDEKDAVGLLQVVYSVYGEHTDQHSETDARLKQLAQRAETLVKANWQWIERTAKQLLERECLSGSDVQKLEP
jgi:ATP-dependent Zn protease